MDKDRAAQLVEAGIWLRLSGDQEGARRLFERALKLDPSNEKAQQLLSPSQRQSTGPPPREPSAMPENPFERPRGVEVSALEPGPPPRPPGPPISEVPTNPMGVARPAAPPISEVPTNPMGFPSPAAPPPPPPPESEGFSIDVDWGTATGFQSSVQRAPEGSAPAGAPPAAPVTPARDPGAVTSRTMLFAPGQVSGPPQDPRVEPTVIVSSDIELPTQPHVISLKTEPAYPAPAQLRRLIAAGTEPGTPGPASQAAESRPSPPPAPSPEPGAADDLDLTIDVAVPSAPRPSEAPVSPLGQNTPTAPGSAALAAAVASEVKTALHPSPAGLNVFGDSPTVPGPSVVPPEAFRDGPVPAQPEATSRTMMYAGSAPPPPPVDEMADWGAATGLPPPIASPAPQIAPVIPPAAPATGRTLMFAGEAGTPPPAPAPPAANPSQTLLFAGVPSPAPSAAPRPSSPSSAQRAKPQSSGSGVVAPGAPGQSGAQKPVSSASPRPSSPSGAQKPASSASPRPSSPSGAQKPPASSGSGVKSVEASASPRPSSPSGAQKSPASSGSGVKSAQAGAGASPSGTHGAPPRSLTPTPLAVQAGSAASLGQVTITLGDSDPTVEVSAPVSAPAPAPVGAPVAGLGTVVLDGTPQARGAAPPTPPPPPAPAAAAPADSFELDIEDEVPEPPSPPVVEEARPPDPEWKPLVVEPPGGLSSKGTSPSGIRGLLTTSSPPTPPPEQATAEAPTDPAWAWRSSSSSKTEAGVPPPRPTTPEDWVVSPDAVPKPSPQLAPHAQSAWDVKSDPGINLSAVVGEAAAFDLLTKTDRPSGIQAAPASPNDLQTYLSGAKDLLDLDDHTGAMELILRAEQIAPTDPQVVALKERSEKTLVAMFESKLGSLAATPRVLLKEDEIIWLNLDHRAGFVLAQIDGSVCFEDLFAVSGMTRIDTARILAQLVDEGVISRG